jgi:hypothetical protein
MRDLAQSTAEIQIKKKVKNRSHRLKREKTDDTDSQGQWSLREFSRAFHEASCTKYCEKSCPSSFQILIYYPYPSTIQLSALINPEKYQQAIL